jgi:hypothetical protein
MTRRTWFRQLLSRLSAPRPGRRDLPPAGRSRASRPLTKRTFKPCLEGLEERSLLSTVSNLNDSGPGSLRQALLTGPANDFITFNPNLSGAINLSSPLPPINHNLILFGPGADRITVRRNTGGSYSIFQVSAGVFARISGLAITNGSAGPGGGVGNRGTLTLDAVAVTNNSADGDGGGISNGGTLTISNSTISGNTANAEGSGGGVLNVGTLVVSNSTLAGNNAGAGGGGAIDNQGSLTLENSTPAGNLAGVGGGLYESGVSGSHTQARNTIIAANTAAAFPDVQGNIGSRGHNLIGNTSGGFGFAASDLRDVDPVLGPLQNNGGPTQTRALLPGSPAVDAGDNTDAPFFDQRGLTRVVGGTIDIGAFEAQIGAATQLVVSGPAGVVANTPFDVTVTARDAYNHVAGGYQGTVTFAVSDPADSEVLPDDYTFTADDAGSHAFAGGVTLIALGDRTLTATDTADPTTTGSTVVTVTDGPGSGGGGGAAPFFSNGRLEENLAAPPRLLRPTYTPPPLDDVEAVRQVFALSDPPDDAWAWSVVRNAHQRTDAASLEAVDLLFRDTNVLR